MIEKIEKTLKENGYKITNQRKWVLDVLLVHQHDHMTTEEIYEYVKEEHPEIGLATVYRTIQLFLDLKVIDTLNLNDGVVRYELAKVDQHHHHHHLICEQCKKVIEVEDDLLEEMEEKWSKAYRFNITNHVVKFYGICHECMEKNNNNSH